MTEGPRVHVSVENLHGEAPVALQDSLSAFRLAIDFTWPPERIVEALTDVFQESIDSRRWSRQSTGEHAQPHDQPQDATPHPEGDC